MTDPILVPANEADLKSAQAVEIVKRNMLWSAGAGLLPVPMVELVAITAVELKLINELADHYVVPFSKDLAKSAILSLIGSLGSVTIGKMLALSSMRAIPVFGHLIAAVSVPGMAAAITYAMGKVFISHFESGGTLLDFDPAAMREYFRALFADGLKQGASKASSPSVKPAAA